MALVTIPDEEQIKTVTIGSGGAASTTFDFSYFNDTDIKVYYRDDGAGETSFTLQTLTTNYTITGNAGTEGGFEGGTVNFVSPASLADYTVIIELAIPYTRTTNLPSSGPFPVDTLNVQLSKFVVMVRQLKELIDRVVSVATTDTGSLTLPNAATRASKALTFDSNGDITATALTAFPSATLTSIGTAVGTASTETDARAALELSSVVETKAADFTVVADDYGKTFNLESGVSTVTITAAATLGADFLCRFINKSGGAVSLAPASGNIDEGASYSLADDAAALVICDATEFYVEPGGGASSALTTQGDVLYRGASADERLAAGNANEALLTAGAGANPAWGKVGYHVETLRVNGAVSSVTFSSLPADCNFLVLAHTIGATSGGYDEISVSDDAVNFSNVSGDVHQLWQEIYGATPTAVNQEDATQAGILHTWTQGNKSGVGMSWELWLEPYHIGTAGIGTQFHLRSGGEMNTSGQFACVSSGEILNHGDAPLTDIRVERSAGNFTDGYISVYAFPR